MGALKIGVFLESFRMDVKEAIRTAADLGFEAIQVMTTHGELHPDNLTKSGRQDFLHFVQSHGLKISALCGDFGVGYTDPLTVEEQIELTKKVIDLAVDLGVDIITTHIGVIPEDKTSLQYHTLRDALNELGGYAENYARVLAAETGPEEPELMKRLFKKLKTGAIMINYDPANLVMNGFDPIEGVRTLAPFIVHTHAKDAKHKDGEVPLGEGDVPFKEYIETLKSIGYDGYYVIEREVGEDPVGDIRAAKEFLEQF